MAIDPGAYDDLFEAAGKKYDVDPILGKSVMMAESSGDPNARGTSGELGLMQIMPATARSLGVDPRDPAQAIDGAFRLLRDGLGAGEQAARQNPDINPVSYALQSYNGGSSAHGINRSLANGYPGRVLAAYQKLGGPGVTVADQDQGAGQPPDQGAPGSQQVAAATTDQQQPDQGQQVQRSAPPRSAAAAEAVDQPPAGTVPLPGQDYQQLMNDAETFHMAGNHDLARFYEQKASNLYTQGIQYSNNKFYPMPGQVGASFAKQTAVAAGTTYGGDEMIDFPTKDEQGNIVTTRMLRSEAERQGLLRPRPGLPPASAGAGSPGTGPPGAPGAGPGGTAPTGGPPIVGTPIMTPEQQKQSQALGDRYSAILNESGPKADEMLMRARELRAAGQEFENLPLGGGGPGVETRMAVAERVIGALANVGLKPPEGLARMFATGQIMGKDGAQLLAAMMAQSGYNQAAELWERVGETRVPGITQLPQAYQAITNSIEQSALRARALGSFQDRWIGPAVAGDPNTGHRSIAGMLDAFRRARPIEIDSSRVVPLPWAEGKRQGYMPNVVYQNPNGHRMLYNGRDFDLADQP
jgi:soluble lytic murein transglycosylase-like protein